MRVPIVESKYLSIYIDEEQKLYEQFWYAESEYMSQDDYQRLHLAWVQKMVKYKYDLRYFYLDNRVNYYVISEALQQWHAQYVYTPILENLPHLDKVKTAIIVSEDFLSQLSIELTIKIKEEVNQMTYYFSDSNEARSWLFQQPK